MNWEFWVALGTFAVLFVLVSAWAARRVPEVNRRTHWLTNIAIFVVVVTALGTWELVA